MPWYNLTAMSIVRRFLPYGATATVVRGPARGRRFVVEPGIGLSYLLGRDIVCPRALMKLAVRGSVVYDVGANKGQMALAFSRAVGSSGRVLAFEPAPREAAGLRRNLALNAIGNTEVHELALSDGEGTATFEYSQNSPTQGRLGSSNRTSVEQIRVRITTLDALVSSGAPKPDLLKIDTEGGAAGILRGARRTISEIRPIFYVELHSAEEKAAVTTELLSRGYGSTDLYGNAIELSNANAALCRPTR